MKTLIDKLEKRKAENRYHDEDYGAAINDAIEIIKSHDPWISILDELPPQAVNSDGKKATYSDDILVKGAQGGQVSTGYYRHAYKDWNVDYGVFDVTHWTYIPKQIGE